MAQRRFHYELAFEHYLRARAVPYVCVDEARKALHGPKKLKSFDFVVYRDPGPNLLIDVKGRKHSGRTGRQLHNWVTADDVADMLQWRRVFGEGFTAVFVFLYWCEAQPPDALFHEIFSHRDRWYSVMAVEVEAYRQAMTQRSSKWKTVHVPAATFARIARPLDEILRSGGTSPSPAASNSSA